MFIFEITDVDECATKSPCAEICTNFVGGFSCSCPKGQSLEKDGKSCKNGKV